MVYFPADIKHEVPHTFSVICMGQIGSSLFVVLCCSGVGSDCFYGFPQEGQRQDGRA